MFLFSIFHLKYSPYFINFYLNTTSVNKNMLLGAIVTLFLLDNVYAVCI